MLKRIVLNNFKKHKRLEITFDDGVSCVRGQNAVGKSTVLKAIAYALFGAGAAGSKDHLKTWGSKEPMSVQLVLDLPNHPKAFIHRSEKLARVLDADDNLLASGHTPVTTFLEEQLGLNAKDLRTLMISPQGETQGLLDLGAAALEKRVSEIAKSHVIDKVLSLIGVDVARADGELEGIGELPSLDYLTAGLNRATVGALRAQAEVDWAADDLKQRKADSARYEAEHQAALRLQGQHSLLRQRYEQLELNIFNLKKETQTLTEVLTAEGELLTRGQVDGLKQCCTEQQVAFNEAQALRYDFLSTGTKLQKTQEWLTENEPKLAAALATEVEVEVAEARLTECKEATAQEQEAHKEAYRVVQTLLKAVYSSVCPECGREYEEGAKVANEAKLVVAEEALALVFNRLTLAKEAQAEAAQNVLTARSKLVPGLKDKIDTARADIEALRAELEGFSAKGDPTVGMQQAKSRLEELQASLEQVIARFTKQQGLQDRIAGLGRNLTDAQANLESVDLDLANLAPVPNITELETTIAAAKTAQAEAESKHMDAVSALHHVKQDVALMQQEFTRVEKLTARRAELEAQVADVKSLQTYLRKNRGRLMADTWDALLNYTSALVSSVTEGRLSSLSRTNGDFMIKEDDREIPCEELSGGQKSIVGICLRLALSQVFYGKGLTLLLDEPAADLADDMAAALSGMLRGLGHQVVMVTHRQGDASVADEVIEIGG